MTVDIEDKYSRTPLYYASDIKVIFAFLQNNADFIVDKQKLDNLFHIQQDVNIISKILGSYPGFQKFINERNADDVPPLFECNSDVFRCFVEHNADLNVTCSFTSQRQINGEAIYGTVTSGKPDIVRNYLNNVEDTYTSISSYDKSIDTEFVDIETYEALKCHEIDNDHCEIVEYEPKTRFTVLMKRASYGKLSSEIMELCLKHEYDIHFCTIFFHPSDA